ncbi:MAG: CYTH domain-containing protein [Alphaproteobacteria bacterium]
MIAEKAVLRPVFTVRSERTSWHRTAEGVDVEFALDRGEIIAGGNKSSLCELEIELKQGAPRDLFDVARVLSESSRLRPTVFAKSDRGYRLLDETWGKPARAKAAPLFRADDAAHGVPRHRAFLRAALHAERGSRAPPAGQ